VDEILKEYRQNMVVLEKQLEERIKKNTELERVDYIKQNNQDTIDLMNISMYRILLYKKHSNTYMNPQILKKFILDVTRTSRNNLAIASEAIKSIFASSFHTNQLFRIKTEFQVKYLETPYWYLIINEVSLVY